MRERHATTNLWLMYPSSFELFEMPGILQGLALNAPGTGGKVGAYDVIAARSRERVARRSLARTRYNDGFPADCCTRYDAGADGC